MFKLEKERSQKIKTILFTLKILVILFSVFPLFQKFFPGVVSNTEFNYEYSLYSVIFALAVVGVVMFLWTMLNHKNARNKFFITVELIIFFTLFLIAVYCSGGAHSPYKFLFMFIIVSHTIEYGMRMGFLVSVLSSGIIILIDICNLFVEKYIVNFFENDLALIAMFISIAWTLGYYVKVEADHMNYLKEHANTDGLTGIYNHRCFYDTITQMCEQENSIALIMLDVDRFKEYNDAFGHQKGDELLIGLVAFLKDRLVPDDLLFRYGGDEFCILMTGCTIDQAKNFAEYLRVSTQNEFFVHDQSGHQSNITLSFGIAHSEKRPHSHLDLICSADAALYKAKYLNRNKVQVYSSLLDRVNHGSDAPDSADALRATDTLHSMKALISVINSRDDYTFNHTERVASYCAIMANSLGLSDQQEQKLIYAAYLHDLGKINLDKQLLITDKALNTEEIDEIHRHSEYGAAIISQIDGLEEIADIVKQHHERVDGTGYPCGLKGDSIHYLARILTIADSYDAMTNNRPYKKKLSQQEAFSEISQCSGTQFDASLANVFIKNMAKL